MQSRSEYQQLWWGDLCLFCVLTLCSPSRRFHWSSQPDRWEHAEELYLRHTQWSRLSERQDVSHLNVHHERVCLTSCSAALIVQTQFCPEVCDVFLSGKGQSQRPGKAVCPAVKNCPPITPQTPWSYAVWTSRPPVRAAKLHRPHLHHQTQTISQLLES